MDLLPPDWSDLWSLETPLLEIFVRGAVLYLGILLLLRVMPRRTGGELATMDLVLLLLVTEAATHSLGDYTSLGDGLLMIATVMLLNFTVNALSYRFRWFERLVSNPPIPIVIDGRMLPRNMRREFITEEELDTHLRRHGIDHLSQVKRACVEGEGQITFVRREG